MNIITQEARKKQEIVKQAIKNEKSQTSRKYGVSLSTLKRWCKKYDGTWQSRWILSFKDVQRPSGQLPGIVPTCSWGYNWGNGPAWDGALIIIPYNIWKYTEDFSLIEQMWDNMCLLLEFMDSMASENILSYGLSDWITPKSAKKILSR